jgi:hypothetical protein
VADCFERHRGACHRARIAFTKFPFKLRMVLLPGHGW